MEMPELLRLSLGVSSRHAETRVDSGENAGLGRWTVFAACHWDEENGNDYYFSDAGKRSYDIFGANKGDESGYTSLEHKSHYVTLAQLFGEGSAMLRDCHQNRAACSDTSSGSSTSSRGWIRGGKKRLLLA